MLAAHQRDGDAHEARAGGEVQRQVVRRAHHGVDGAEARERARHEHRHDDRAADFYARVVRGVRIEARRAQLVAPRRTPYDDAVDYQGEDHDDKTDVQRRVAQHRQELAQQGQGGAVGEHARGRVLLAFRDQVFDDHEVHQARGDEVEHDRRDDDVAAPLRLQVAGNEGPQRAEDGRADHRERNQEDARHMGVERQHDPRQAQAAHIHLAFRADVEEARLHRDRHGEAREDEGACVEQRVREAFRIEDGAVDEDAERFRRALAQQVDHEPRDEQGRHQVQDGQDETGGPAWQFSLCHDVSACASRP